uniref:WIYLD domain-containing protein n=1 Tax=Leersia perrieri TaxID=77586 RepID=A0A0D9XBB4_9ORYZ
MPPRGRARRGNQRIDAAIDHFVPMGYSVADVRAVVKDLLKVYGKDGWPFLEEGVYRVVQDALFEKQEQEDKLQLQLLQEEEEIMEDQDPLLQLEGAVDDGPLENIMSIEVHNEQMEGEMDDAPLENSMSIVHYRKTIWGFAVRSRRTADTLFPVVVPVHDGIPSEAESFTDPPVLEAILPPPDKAAVTSVPRRPCYGWISESETESESDNEDQPPSGQCEHCKRNRSRYEHSNW